MSARAQAVLGLIVGSACLGVTSVHAYQNPERFGASIDDGGGAGRYFTLSRAEGYGCAVCHTQGSPVPVEIRNLPHAGYVPGQAYRITLDWPDDMPSVALNVEMTDPNGAPFGQLIAPDPNTLSAADLCHESEQPSAAQTMMASASNRQVLVIAECGQAQTSFDWIAPSTLVQGYFSSSITFSNHDGKLSGDHVVDLSETLGPVGVDQPITSSYQSACSSAGTGLSARKLRGTVWPFVWSMIGLRLCPRWRRRAAN